MTIKVTFKNPIKIEQHGFTAEITILLCKSIELNGYGMVKIDNQFYCSELDILKIELI